MNTYSRRFHVVWNPIELVRREITGRYLMYYYNQHPRNATFALAVRLKVLGLVSYVAGLLLALSSHSLRSHTRGQLLIFLPPLAALLLAIGDFIQFPQYFLHVFPFAVALLAAAMAYLWEQGRAHVFLGALFVFTLLVGLGGLAAKIRANAYHTIYLPVVDSILPHMTTTTLVDGPCELIFGLGDSHVIDGVSREQYLAHKPEFIVIGHSFGYAKVYDPKLMKPLTATRNTKSSALNQMG
ncbi:MAG: hypothetical protein JO182_31730 [Acidobacteriaceae bacterium]|nr:hypothetical protein [Acidobacteriaceae bacterium]